MLIGYQEQVRLDNLYSCCSKLKTMPDSEKNIKELFVKSGLIPGYLVTLVEHEQKSKKEVIHAMVQLLDSFNA
jgi:hypothetical protein